ncbi:gp5 [Mycobacterium phage PLot]|uniref:Uncharacterized protein n=1 Tax=Mycobacterium phage PLot TaxID=373411 RepID=Q19YE4_9CAUD|nr:gp5 [Mycobacterium phage PLot]ABD58604.1 hypothetical protein PBI_PLOT_5 [Mycobacterium phage PLot]
MDKLPVTVTRSGPVQVAGRGPAGEAVVLETTLQLWRAANNQVERVAHALGLPARTDPTE